MGQFLDVGQEATGVIAIGQVATGVIAIGQMATGVIAIGQVARGGLAIGMGAFGLVTLGMVSVGVISASGLGVGGSGRGLVVRLVPRLQPRRRLPPVTTEAAFEARTVSDGWVLLSARRDGGGVRLYEGERPLPIKLASALLPAALAYATSGGREALAHVTRVGDGLVCGRLMEVPASQLRSAGFWIWLIFGFMGLLVLSALFWMFVAVPVGDAILGPGGALR